MARQNNDFGTVMGRQVARESKALRAPDEPSLQIEMLKLLDQRFRVRAGKINRQYDREIRHGKESYYQSILALTLVDSEGRSSSKL